MTSRAAQELPRSPEKTNHSGSENLDGIRAIRGMCIGVMLGLFFYALVLIIVLLAK